MQSQYDSVEDIRKDYAKRIKEVADDEDAVRGLRLEEREAMADLRERQAAARELDATRATVLANSGLPEDYHEYVVGGTPEELQASADKLKERLAKLSAPAAPQPPQPTAASMYGSTAGAGGSPPAQRDTEEEKLGDFAKRYNESIVGSRVDTSPNESQATWSKREGDEYVKKRLGAHATVAMARYSKNTVLRQAAQELARQRGWPT